MKVIIYFIKFILTQMMSTQSMIPAQQMMPTQSMVPAQQIMSTQGMVPAQQMISTQSMVPSQQLVSFSIYKICNFSIKKMFSSLEK
jgi:hypothetical protein